MTTDIKVSISCLTYNHEKYIAQTIEGFLLQKTTFKYEILIHDDASTDNTSRIVQEYADKYPSLIKPLIQTENQYSQGVRVEILNRKRALGEYYALCEGDDYWTDPLKLQKQVDCLDNNPQFSVCVHAADIVDAKSEKVVQVNWAKKPSHSVYNIEEVIMAGGGLFVTNSMLIRRDAISELPQFYLNAPVGDYPLLIHAAMSGDVYFLDEVMSAYRINVAGSWTMREFTSLENRQKHLKKIAVMLDEVNAYADYRYQKAIEWTKNKNEFLILQEKGDLVAIRDARFREHYVSLSKKSKLAIRLHFCCPRIYQLALKVKRLLAP